jgi:hypothetical protein
LGSENSIEAIAEELLASTRQGPANDLTALYATHAFEEEPCELCEWVSGELELGEDWFLESIIENPNCPDELLQKMIYEFKASPGAWGIAAGIQEHPNASALTRELATEYVEEFDAINDSDD